MRNNRLLFLASLFFLTSCTVGRKMTYQNENVPVDYKPAKSVVVIFHDEREEVVSAKQKPTFVGQVSSAVAIPYNMQTESGKPLAVEFANAVNTAIINKGLQSSVITLAHTDSVSTALSAFSKSNQERLLVFKIHKWQARGIPGFSQINYQIVSDFELNIYDTSGSVIASSSVKDLTERKQDVALSVKHLQAMASEVFKNEMRQLFNDPSIMKALQ